jgi:hypothetical protein
LQVAVASLRSTVRSLAEGRAGVVRVRRRVNVRSAVNVGSSGATQTASAVQSAPIIQTGGAGPDA